MNITLKINGTEHAIDTAPSTTLLAALRGLGFHGVKFGDEGGLSGSDTVLLDGKPVMSERRPIAVDAPNVRRFAVAGHGCNLSKAPLPNGTGAKWAGIVALWLYIVRSGRRKRRASHSKPG